jgi:hypothetical protein
MTARQKCAQHVKRHHDVPPSATEISTVYGADRRPDPMLIHTIAVQTQPAEPAIGQVEMHLVTQPPLRADAKAISDDQHADEQFRIDRGSAGVTIELRQMCTHRAEVDEPVDGPEHVTCRNMPVQRELIK